MRACTTVMIDDVGASTTDNRAQTLAHGVLALEQVDFNYGADRRRLRVRKLRGSSFLSGSHDFVIARGGIVVYPRLVAAHHDAEPANVETGEVSSGLVALDALAGGGLRRGSSTLIMGPAGTGKSTLASLYVHAAAGRGERSSVQLFDESVCTFLARSRGLGIGLAPYAEDGRLLLDHVDPAELTPGEIAHRIVRHVVDENARLVVLDSVNGYLQSGAADPTVLLHLRELLSYLSRRGVVTLMTMTQHGMIGAGVSAPVDVSLIADNVFLLRFIEADAELHLALSMVKRRAGPHERTIRELHLESGEVVLGEPLTGLTGVLSGAPQSAQPLRPT